MTAYVSSKHETDGWHWTIIRAIPGSADLVLRGIASYPDVMSCELAGANIGEALSHASVIQRPDGTWIWSCHADDGTLLVRSEPFDDAAHCGEDLSRTRLIAGHAVLAPDLEPPDLVDSSTGPRWKTS